MELTRKLQGITLPISLRVKRRKFTINIDREEVPHNKPGRNKWSFFMDRIRSCIDSLQLCNSQGSGMVLHPSRRANASVEPGTTVLRVHSHEDAFTNPANTGQQDTQLGVAPRIRIDHQIIMHSVRMGRIASQQVLVKPTCILHRIHASKNDEVAPR